MQIYSSRNGVGNRLICNSYSFVGNNKKNIQVIYIDMQKNEINFYRQPQIRKLQVTKCNTNVRYPVAFIMFGSCSYGIYFHRTCGSRESKLDNPTKTSFTDHSSHTPIKAI